MSRVFVAVDFSFIDDSKWYDFTTATNQFQKDAGVFVSIPQIPGRNPAAIKMKQESVRNSDGTVSFSIKIVQPNDSFCNKSFGWIPQYLKPTLISWMVFEYGAYTINSYTFFAGKGTLTRSSWSKTATFTNGNLIAIAFPTGCVTTTDSCVFPDVTRGAINLLQTSNNAKDPTKDMYLTVRSKQIDLRRGQWVLIPHDVIPRDFSTYFTLSAETLAYLIFPTGVQIECFEKMIWETRLESRNYIPLKITYANVYDYAPGIYGMVGTITSLGNTVLVSANWTSTSSVISINEDQCAEAEYTHVQAESIFLAVIGEKKTTTSTYLCYVNFNSALDPTSAPSTFPTFRPSSKPTTFPTFLPTATPTLNPTRAPTTAPTAAPTFAPTRAPTTSPTVAPTTAPTTSPTTAPTVAPTTAPTFTPSSNPTFTPTGATASPTFNPTANPTRAPTFNPTLTPSSFPTFTPSSFPTFKPSSFPTFNPSVNPTANPTVNPTTNPTLTPSSFPTFTPSSFPTFKPSSNPTYTPSSFPTFTPSSFPTFNPSSNPTYAPSSFPTFNPSTNPTFTPSSFPTFAPSSKPTFNPSFNPTFAPSSDPTFKPSSNPTFKPTISPTFAPSTSPTFSPSSVPTLKPTVPPTFRPTTPTVSPTMFPTYQPTKLCTSAFPVKIKKVQV